MRALLTTILTACLTLPAFAGWTVTSETNLTLTQYAYSDNWEGSETGALSWAADTRVVAESQLTSVLHTRNRLELEYGQTHNQNAETNEWSRPVNSTDDIDFETVWRFTLGGLVDPFAAGRLESQFTDERDPDETRYINPMILTESLGAARQIVDDGPRQWSVRLGGALRQHIDDGVLNAETDEIESETTVDSGLEFVSEYATPLAGERLTFTSKLGVYQALYFSESEDIESDDWRSPDVEWENKLSAGITDFLMVNLNLDAFYDKEIDGDLRLRQTLSLGLTWATGDTESEDS